MAIDLTKEYVKLNIDVTTCIVNEDFWAKQGDTGRGFIITLVVDKQVIVPSGELVQLHLLKPDGKQVWINSDIKDEKFYIHLTNQSLMATGIMYGEFVIGSQGKVKRTETFIIDVRPSLTDGAYESTNEFGDLDILIQKIEQYAPSMETWSLAEDNRAYEEGLRVVSENERASNELVRKANETTRTSSESTRISNENTRVSNENARNTSESGRVSAEGVRVSNENARISNEATRQSNELQRQSQISQALQNIQDAVDTTKIIWKSPVQTYPNIATTYPNPELGWRVETLDTKFVYRYDGASWVYVTDNSASANSEVMSNKGVANGYAPLDATAKVPVQNIPDEAFAPTIHSGAVSTVLDANLTANKVLISSATGKISSSSVDSLKISYLSNVHTDIQSQINNKASSVHSHAISDVTNLDTELFNKAQLSHTHTSQEITDMATILSGKADSTHAHAISDVSGLQTAIDSKQAIITGAASTITSANLQPNLVVVTDDLGKVSESSVTELELLNVSGTTDNIQSQLDDKAPLNHEHDYLSLTAGGNVSGLINATGGLVIDGKRISVQSTAPTAPAIGDVWIKI